MRSIRHVCLVMWLMLAATTATVARGQIPLPRDVGTTAEPRVHDGRERYLGVWGRDAWSESRPAAVEVEVDSSTGGLTVTNGFDRDHWRPFPSGFLRSAGRIENGELVTALSPVVTGRYRLLPDGRLFARLERRGTWHEVRYAIFERLPTEPQARAAAPADTEARPWRMVDIPMTDPGTGRPITLKATFYPPVVPGPVPLLLMNHGDVTPGVESLVQRHGELARLFVSRGWAVLELMRRGAGGSGGTLLPEIRRDGPLTAEYGDRRMASDIADVDAALAAVRAWPQIDAHRILLGGQSRGGLIAIEYLAARPESALGAINFSGGAWSEADERTFLQGRYTRDRFARAGAVIRKPTLWLYGDNDRYYSAPFIQSWFDAYRAAGGDGTLRIVSGVPRNGHDLVFHPDFWESTMLDMITRITDAK
ncbi:hypothetical protein FHP25_10670 [Vineibacter terrae]|uniref:Uncharacterized protein n=2 Tax=Vineibacter terrae TaxID=2586908 RepID=A0A5C8PPK3_9HYPH|nr:hypothetical protein FHP25_10670 [Vineibacter terrae]